jgi:hypothetical protein
MGGGGLVRLARRTRAAPTKEIMKIFSLVLSPNRGEDPYSVFMMAPHAGVMLVELIALRSLQ